MRVQNQSQIALWVTSPGPDAVVELKHDVPIPEPQSHQVLVHLEYSGLCHSDVYNITGAHPMQTNIPGHEGVGTIVKLGDLVSEELRLGQRVGVKWINETCGTCDICLRDPTACPEQNNSGRDRPGTLQQYVTVAAEHASPIPDGLSGNLAAPLLCAGLTLYSAIGRARAQAGDYVVITGAGGGLGHLGIQIANVRGLKVISIDAEEKRDFCTALGSSFFFAFNDPDLEEKVKKLTGSSGAHAAICCAGAEQSYTQALNLLRRGGTLVCVGLPANMSYQLPISPFDMVVKGLNIVGSSVGTEAELQELLELAQQGSVVPKIQLLPLSRFAEAIDLVISSTMLGKIVLQIPGDVPP